MTSQLKTYRVYVQRTPIHLGTNDKGEPEHRANLTEVGTVQAKSTAEAIALAKALGLALAPVVSPAEEQT